MTAPRLRLVLCLVGLAAAAPPASGQPVRERAAVVAGAVVDGSGAPIPYATVALVDGVDGGVTGADGRFVFSTRVAGSQAVEARSMGLEPARARVTLVPGDTARVRLVLREALLELAEAVASADAFVAGSGEVRGLSPLDVVTTPGAAADLFLAVQTFPGLAQVDDGAGLFVRGGDVSETAVLLDGARVLRPYKYESPLGATFGTVSPYLVDGTRFSSGGFSARHGDALSAVLDLESQDEPSRPARTVSAGLAAASVRLDQPLDGLGLGRAGVRAAANRSFTDLLFWVNGQTAEFETTPRSTDGSALVVVPYGGGQVKALGLASRDRVGVRVERPSFEGVYRGESGSALGVVSGTALRGRWLLRGSASTSQAESRREVGALDLRPTDAATRLRVEGEREAGERLRLTVGAEGEHLRSSAVGTVPLGDPYAPAVASAEVDVAVAAARVGAWAEVEAQPTRRLVVTAGLRADGHTAARQVGADPRLSAQLALNAHTRLRVTWGLYGQFPSLNLYARNRAGLGDDRLRQQRAQHLVAGVLHERGALTLRAEGYVKPYHDLAIETGPGPYETAGRGLARGLDLFARLGEVGRRRVSGWASYSLIDSRRTQLRRLGTDTALEEGPAPFGVAHTATLVAKVMAWRTLALGGRLRAASGRPVTPVVAAVPSGEDGAYLPVEGPVGSERLPAFVRLDLQTSYLTRVGSSGTLVLFAALSNVLDRANVVGYRYAADYATRTPELTSYRRSIYVGATYTF